MKNIIITLLIASVLSYGNVQAYDPTHSLHGSRASFLMQDSRWMTLNYLHPNANKIGMRNAAKANGDTHIYLYSRNGGDGFNGGPKFDLSVITPKPDWEAQLDLLNAAGLKPVMWLTPDDSRAITVQSLDAQKAHFNEIVRRFNDKVTGYVACLECDEYWSPAKVNALVIHLKSITDKPVGVHLTSGIGGRKGNKEYYANADYVFLQTGWNKTPAEITAMVKQAIAVTGKPVVASEYAVESRTAAARALGNAACRAGAIGTGNGRSIIPCGYEAPLPKEANFIKKHEKELISIAGVSVAIAAIYFYNKQFEEMPFDFSLKGTENYQVYGVDGSVNVTNNTQVGLNFERTDLNYDTDNRLTFYFSGEF
jgi:hypothetical protein